MSSEDLQVERLGRPIVQREGPVLAGVRCPPAPELLLRLLQNPPSPHLPTVLLLPAESPPVAVRRTSSVTPVMLDPQRQDRDKRFILSFLGKILLAASPVSSQRPHRIPPTPHRRLVGGRSPGSLVTFPHPTPCSTICFPSPGLECRTNRSWGGSGRGFSDCPPASHPSGISFQ